MFKDIRGTYRVEGVSGEWATPGVTSSINAAAIRELESSLFLSIHTVVL